jgi:hypothetical protein
LLDVGNKIVGMQRCMTMMMAPVAPWSAPITTSGGNFDRLPGVAILILRGASKVSSTYHQTQSFPSG